MVMSLDEEIHNFQAAVGKAITRWSRLEDDLMKVFVAAIRAPDNAPPAAAFFAVINFNTKLQMTEAALYAALGDQSIFKDWQKLRDQINTSNKFRVRLAHHSLVSYPQAEPGQRAQLEPTIHNPDTWPSGRTKPKPTVLSAVTSASERFDELSKQLSIFSERISNLEMPPSKSHVRRDGSILPQSLKAQFRKTSRKHDQSSLE